MAVAEFWYDFASTYSYPAAMRVASVAQERGVSLTWAAVSAGADFRRAGVARFPF